MSDSLPATAPQGQKLPGVRDMILLQTPVSARISPVAGMDVLVFRAVEQVQPLQGILHGVGVDQVHDEGDPLLVGFFDSRDNLFVRKLCFDIFDKECILHLSCRVVLWSEQCIKYPE